MKNKHMKDFFCKNRTVNKGNRYTTHLISLANYAVFRFLSLLFKPNFILILI